MSLWISVAVSRACIYPKDSSVSCRAGPLAANSVFVCLGTCKSLLHFWGIVLLDIDILVASFFRQQFESVLPPPSGSLVSDEKAANRMKGPWWGESLRPSCRHGSVFLQRVTGSEFLCIYLAWGLMSPLRVLITSSSCLGRSCRDFFRRPSTAFHFSSQPETCVACCRCAQRGLVGSEARFLLLHSFFFVSQAGWPPWVPVWVHWRFPFSAHIHCQSASSAVLHFSYWTFHLQNFYLVLFF